MRPRSKHDKNGRVVSINIVTVVARPNEIKADLYPRFRLIHFLTRPGMQLMTKFIILHAAMLTMRLSFDVNHAFGADLQ